MQSSDGISSVTSHQGSSSSVSSAKMGTPPFRNSSSSTHSGVGSSASHQKSVLARSKSSWSAVRSTSCQTPSSLAAMSGSMKAGVSGEAGAAAGAWPQPLAWRPSLPRAGLLEGRARPEQRQERCHLQHGGRPCQR